MICMLACCWCIGRPREKLSLCLSLAITLTHILSLADWFFPVPFPFYTLLSHPLLSPITCPFLPLSILPPLFAGPFLRSASWSTGAGRWPRGDGAEWRSSFRQWLNLSDMGERSQGTPNRTPWASRTSRYVCVCIVCARETKRKTCSQSVRSACIMEKP